MRCVRIDYQLDTARSCTARITWIGDGAGDGTTETPCSDPTVIAPLVGKGEKRTYACFSLQVGTEHGALQSPMHK